MSRNGLEAGIQQRGVHAVGGLLWAGSGPAVRLRPARCRPSVAGVRGGQTCESRSNWTPRSSNHCRSLTPVHAVRVRREQGGHVAAQVAGPHPRPHAGPRRLAGLVLPLVIGLHREGHDTGRLHRRDSGHRGLLVQQQHLFERNVADLGRVAERSASRGQRHLTVGSRGKGWHSVDLVVGEPRQRRRCRLLPATRGARAPPAAAHAHPAADAPKLRKRPMPGSP